MWSNLRSWSYWLAVSGEACVVGMNGGRMQETFVRGIVSLNIKHKRSTV